jgi:hypothetical protein
MTGLIGSAVGSVVFLALYLQRLAAADQTMWFRGRRRNEARVCLLLAVFGLILFAINLLHVYGAFDA